LTIIIDPLQEALTKLHRPVNQMVNVVTCKYMMAVDSFIAFDLSSRPVSVNYTTSKSVRHLRWNDVPRTLPTVEERHAMFDRWSERKTTVLFIKFISFHS